MAHDCCWQAFLGCIRFNNATLQRKELSQSGYELDHEGALQQLEMLSAELERLRTPVRASKPSNS